MIVRTNKTLWTTLALFMLFTPHDALFLGGLETILGLGYGTAKLIATKACTTKIGLMAQTGGAVYSELEEQGKVATVWEIADVKRHEAVKKWPHGYQPAEGISVGRAEVFTNDPWDLIIMTLDGQVKIPWTSLQVNDKFLANVDGEDYMRDQSERWSNPELRGEAKFEIVDLSNTGSNGMLTKGKDAYARMTSKGDVHHAIGQKGSVYYTLTMDTNGQLAAQASAAGLFTHLKRKATWGRGGLCALPHTALATARRAVFDQLYTAKKDIQLNSEPQECGYTGFAVQRLRRACVNTDREPQCLQGWSEQARQQQRAAEEAERDAHRQATEWQAAGEARLQERVEASLPATDQRLPNLTALHAALAVDASALPREGSPTLRTTERRGRVPAQPRAKTSARARLITDRSQTALTASSP